MKKKELETEIVETGHIKEKKNKCTLVIEMIDQTPVEKKRKTCP